MQVKINFENIKSNVKKIKGQLNDGVKMCAVVKANAYGHGLAEVAQYIENDVDFFAVARFEEAMLLRSVGIKKQILVLNPLLPKSDVEIAGKYDITLTADGAENLQLFADNKVKIHLKVDTGMNRLGVKYLSEAKKLCLRCKQSGVIVDGIYSHFASTVNADPKMTFKQYRTFCKFTQTVKSYYPNVITHICNTSGALCCPAFQCDMVRIGIGLYGYTDRKFFTLNPCKTVLAKVVETKRIKEGQTVGYDCKYLAGYEDDIAVLDCGYGDGLFREYGSGGQVLTNYGKMPIIGNICMDLLMIKNVGKQLKKGDTVILLGKCGKNSIRADEIAKICGTIPYEILCNLRNR